MNHPNPSNSQLALIPLGAGDLIDRSVRFYRKNFWTFVLIAAPPVIIGAVFLIGWMMLARTLFAVNPANPYDTTFYPVFISLGRFLIWGIQLIAVFVVMGGASRNFVRHILLGEAMTFRETYKNIRSRIGGLTIASGLLIILLGIFGLILFYSGLLIGFIAIAIAVLVFESIPIVAFLLSLALGLATLFGTLWLFFLVVSRFVYIPQIMLVEGRGAFSAIGRSAALAGKNVKRVAALFIFTVVAISSALALLYMPLLWYAWANGLDLFGLEAADTLPAWYEIAAQVVTEISLILLIPILLIGLCLLYVDERVRSEGYDIELMAAQRLGEIPTVPQSYINPLHPALANQGAPGTGPPPGVTGGQPAPESSTGSVLGLD